jgi:dTDP-4-amino-4,6-dideoxygalactose transaminase
LWQRLIRLPLWSGMTDEALDEVVGAVEQSLSELSLT